MSALDLKEERPAFVRFELRPVEDKKASTEAGHVVCKDVEYALVTPPYSKDCVEYKVERWLANMDLNLRNNRIPAKWAKQWRDQLQAWRAGNEAPVDGTDIRNWSAISPAQIKNLIAAGCRTIEDLAAINDQGMRAIGMGANELKKKAVAYMQATKDHGPLVMKTANLERENEQLKGTISSLEDKINRLSSQVYTMTTNNREFREEYHPPDSISASDIFEPAPQINESELDQVRNEYQVKFDQKPNPLKKIETLRKNIASGVP